MIKQQQEDQLKQQQRQTQKLQFMQSVLNQQQQQSQALLSLIERLLVPLKSHYCVFSPFLYKLLLKSVELMLFKNS